jgi:hypothetical protein
MLSGPLFLFFGLGGVPILIFGEAIPRLKALFSRARSLGRPVLNNEQTAAARRAMP